MRLTEPGNHIEGDCENTEVRKRQSSAHNVQLRASANQVNDSTAAIRLDIVVNDSDARSAFAQFAYDA
jgi:hypothetical protein